MHESRRMDQSRFVDELLGRLSGNSGTASLPLRCAGTACETSSFTIRIFAEAPNQTQIILN